jgi:exodeoxyribonuclease VII large subunit
VVDIVAHTKMKTPTAVAEFLISGMRSFEETVIDFEKKITAHAEKFLRDEKYRLNAVTQRLALIPLRIASAHLNKILILHRDLRGHIKQLIRKEDNRFSIMEQAVRHLDPANVLRRGYSITRHRGKVIRDSSSLKKWAVIDTIFHKGSVTSIVQDRMEVKESEQRQAGNLLPGFD